MEAKKQLKGYLDALIDDEGLKTEVTITLTDQTLWKIVGALVGSGLAIVLVAQLLKNAIPNKQLAENNRLLRELKNAMQ